MTAHEQSACPSGTDSDSEGFWEELIKGKLALPRCADCGQGFFPPLPRCPHCASEAVETLESEGMGTIYSWVRIHRTVDPEFADEVPYTVVAVDLEDGGRMLGRFLGDGDAQIGVWVGFERWVNRGVVVPAFRALESQRT
jgi:uncharacterized OB-fold protein